MRDAVGEDVYGEFKTWDIGDIVGCVGTLFKTKMGEISLLATGATHRHLGVPGEDDYYGRGVSYCATCDGEFFTGKEVLVVGGGFAAAEESVFLTKYASKVTVLVREPDFTCDAAVAAEAKNNPKIDVRYQVELKGVTFKRGARVGMSD